MAQDLKLETCNCDLCGRNNAGPYKTIDQWTLVQCPACKLVYLNPRPTANELSKLYSQEYYRTRQLQFDHSPDEVAREIAIREPSASQLTAEAGKVGRWLDIGCASGYLIAAARKLGWDVGGVEISEWSSGFARNELGLDVFCGTLLDFERQRGARNFDLITAMAYLEHSPSPIGDLRTAARLIKPGGILVIKTPNVTSFDMRWHGNRWHGWHLPYHLYHFSPQTLSMELKATGFKILRLEPDLWNPRVHYWEARLGDGWRADHPDEGRAASRPQPSSSSLPEARSRSKDAVRRWLGQFLTGRNMMVYARKNP